jgi:hypothetical protein
VLADGGGRGVMLGNARLGGTGLGCVGSGVTVSIERRKVRWVAWVGQARARGRSVGRTGFDWSVGPLDPGDGSQLHHPR